MARGRRTRFGAAGVIVLAGVCGLTGCTSPGSPSASPAGTSAVSSSGSARDDPLFLVNSHEATALRGDRSRFGSVIRHCDTQASRQPHPVATLALDPHYTASGVDPSSHRSDPLAPDAQMAYRDGLCFLVTGETRYATHAQSIIDAWTKTLKSAPTLQGKDAINFDMPYLIGAATWVRGANNWSPSAFISFLQRVVMPDAQLANPNNHGMWAVLMEASAATFTGDRALMGSAENRWAQILQGEVMPDGSMPREAERSNTNNYRGGPNAGIKGLAYTHFTLEPASISAKLFADAGQPVWHSSSGQLLQKAFVTAATWTSNPGLFPYYKGDKNKLVGVENASYFPLLLKYYPDPDAARVISAGRISADGFDLTTLFAS